MFFKLLAVGGIILIILIGLVWFHAAKDDYFDINSIFDNEDDWGI